MGRVGEERHTLMAIVHNGNLDLLGQYITYLRRNSADDMPLGHQHSRSHVERPTGDDGNGGGATINVCRCRCQTQQTLDGGVGNYQENSADVGAATENCDSGADPSATAMDVINTGEQENSYPVIVVSKFIMFRLAD